MGLPQKKRQSDCSVVVVCKSDSGGIRTHDPQLRRLLLYPTELRNQTAIWCIAIKCVAKVGIFF